MSRLRCAIARAHTPEQAAELHRKIGEHFETHETVVFHQPILGVACGHRGDPQQVEEAFALDDRLADFSLATPNTQWAYLDVDGRGSLRLVDGYIVRDGRIVTRLSSATPRGHIELLEHLGVTGIREDFEPAELFTSTAPDRDTSTTGLVQGELWGQPLEALRLRLPLALVFPWQLRSMSGRSAALEHGAQGVTLALSQQNGKLHLSGQTRHPSEEAKVALDDLVASLRECHCKLDLSLLTLDRVLLHRWHPVEQ